MKCISCETEINPKWKHAVEINVCPFCGKHIMEEHLKNLFAALRETMESLQTYPDQLHDWMLSNFNFIKTDDPTLINFVPKDLQRTFRKNEEERDFQQRKGAQSSIVKVKTENGEEDVLVTTNIQSEEKTNDFFKRAEVIKTGPSRQQLGPNAYLSPVEKTQHLKKMVQQIKKTGAIGVGTSDVGTTNMVIPAEMLESADPEAIAEYQSLISGNEIASSLPSDYDGGDEVPDFILAANIAASGAQRGGSGANANPKDLAHLQRLQAKVAESRRNVSSGAKGSFSRS